VFSSRVLDFYGIANTPFRPKDKPIVVTFVKRMEHRRLQNQSSLFAELGRRNPHISVQMVDFAAFSFPEQIRIARETDILVGAHGAGLTHLMFMRQGAGAIVEIQPQGLDHHGFKNIAGMRGLGYFRVHARIVPPEVWTDGEIEVTEDHVQTTKRTSEIRPKGAPEQKIDQESHGRLLAATNRLERRDEWHFKDLEIEEDRFFEVVEAATKFMYTKGPWSFDVN
jgi:protein O-GlcNAc transferase